MGPATTPSRVLLGRILPAILALLLATSGLAFLPGRVAAWTPGDYNAASESDLVALTNQARAAAGLPALKVNATLRGIARWRSKDMIDRDYFSHSIPGGGDVFAEMTRQGYCYDLAGENIGWNTYPDAEATAAIQEMFMGSPSHRENLLGPAWSVIGIGAYSGDGDKKMWTVLFADPCGAAPTPKPTAKPTAKPTPTPKPTATPTPTPTPKPTPMPIPTPATTATPSGAPSVSPAPTATPVRTPKPTPRPTPRPTPKPTARPTSRPTPAATPTPTPAPTPTPTPGPTPTPTPTPPPTPTRAPTPALTPGPSPAPSPSVEPSPSPGTAYPPGTSLRVRPLPGEPGLVESIVTFILSSFFGSW